MLQVIGRLLICAVVCLQPLAVTAQTASTSKSRVTAERPTALPEDKDLADQFAGAAAGYITQYRILQAAGKESGRFLSLANWLYFNSIDLSDKAFAKSRFTTHLKELDNLVEEVGGASKTQRKDQQELAVQALTQRLNERLSEGERLFARYEKTFNKVIQNSDGSFTIEAR